MSAESFLEFARGPLFVGTFLFMALGLLRIVAIQLIEIRRSWKRTLDHDMPWQKNVNEFIGWVVPSQKTFKTKPLLSGMSFVFHIGLILVPIFFASHIVLWERGMGLSSPGWLEMGVYVADVLTVTTIVSGIGLLLFRIFDPATRFMSGAIDYILLVALLVPFISGFMAVHPSAMIASYTATMIVHVISAEIVFVLLPFTKLAHAVLFPFDRFSSDFYWKLAANGPEKVARVMRGNDLKV